jgi:hypothetical protein
MERSSRRVLLPLFISPGYALVANALATPFGRMQRDVSAAELVCRHRTRLANEAHLRELSRRDLRQRERDAEMPSDG